MTTSVSPSSYSARVRLTLVAGNQRLELASIGPEQITTRTPSELAPGPAQLEVTIEGRTEVYDVQLPNGAVPFEDVILVQVPHHAPSPSVPGPNAKAFATSDWPDDLFVE